MLGSGTQANPYQITTLDDFYEMDDEDCYYKLMNDLDCSTYGDGLWYEHLFFVKELDGNGHALKNMSFFPAGSNRSILTIISTQATVKNLKIRNCIVHTSQSMATGLFESGTSSVITYENCDFEICLNDAGGYLPRLFGKAPKNHVLKNTTLSLQAVTQRFLGLNVGTIQYCNFYIDWRALSYWTGGMFSTQAGTVPCVLSSVRGRLSAPADAQVYSGDSAAMVLFGSPQQCFVALETENIPSIALCGTSSSSQVTGMVLYDSQLAPDTAFTARAGEILGLPTAKCKDKNYLNSVGFVVA